MQLARTGGRKLFGKQARAVFLEWFAATCNVKWAAEQAGFNYKTVLRHRMNDEAFAALWDRAMRQGYARLEAKRLETKRQETPLGVEGDWDAPEMDAMEPARMDAILRERGRELETGVRKQGRRPRIASNAEVAAALKKRLKAFRARVRNSRSPEARVQESKALTKHRTNPADAGLGPGLRRGTEGVEGEDL
ncbi:MAG TPA: hypothetical protein VLK25_12250 [Allosphingosinicella sp.]|nr:hypothetical protein [Allosphingosinicella sp.]